MAEARVARADVVVGMRVAGQALQNPPLAAVNPVRSVRFLDKGGDFL